jgi:hypothetical protein
MAAPSPSTTAAPASANAEFTTAAKQADSGDAAAPQAAVVQSSDTDNKEENSKPRRHDGEVTGNEPGGSETSGTKKNKRDREKDEAEREERSARKRLIKLYEALNDVRGRDDKLEELMDEARYQIKKLKAATEKAEKEAETAKRDQTPGIITENVKPARGLALGPGPPPPPIPAPPGPAPTPLPMSSAQPVSSAPLTGLASAGHPSAPRAMSISSTVTRSTVSSISISSFSSSSSYSRRHGRRRHRRRGRRGSPPPPTLIPHFLPTQSFSIPAVKVTQWHQVVAHYIQPRHPALEVPINEPTAEDHRRLFRGNRLPPIFRRSATTRDPNVDEVAEIEAEAAAALASVDSQLEERQLPERIRIDSCSLKSIIDFENGVNSSYGPFPTPVPHPWTQSFTLIRPFKRLVVMEKEIRSRLAKLEKLRRDFDFSKPPYGTSPDPSIKWPPETEEDYDKLYKLNEPLDITSPTWPIQHLETRHLVELHGFVKNARLLVKFFDDYIAPIQRKAASGKDELVRFCDLWFYFQPGKLVYVSDKKVPQKIWKVGGTTGGRRRLCRDRSESQGSTRDFLETVNDFRMDTFYIDYNGARYLMVLKCFYIKRFDGAVPLSSLPVFPLAVAETLGLVKRPELISRGKRFKACASVSHQYYDGRSLDRSPRGDRLRSLLNDDGGENHYRVSANSERISSEVVVDFERALDEINEWKEEERNGFDDVPDRTETGNSVNIDHDEQWDSLLMDKVWRAEIEKIGNWEVAGAAGPELDEDLLLLPERVFAFVLRDRKWGKCPASNLWLWLLKLD